MTEFVRNGGRAAHALRPVRITRGFTIHAEGSVLIEFGNTKVLCTASVEEKVPAHKKGSGEGWVTELGTDELRRYRQSWGVFRDRRPDLYYPLLSLDGRG